MKKVLVPVALALGLAGAAQAQVTLYGLLDASYGKSVGDAAAGLREDFHSGGDSGSGQGNSTTRFGIKGSTDVGGGVKANFKLESNGITSDGNIPDPFFQRQAWVGLSGSFGEFRLGRQDSVAFQTTVDYDFNGASNGVSALGYAGTAFWNTAPRQSRALNYISPTFGGVKVQVAYVPNGNQPTGGTAFDSSDRDVYSAAVSYAAGPVSVTANYETKRNGTSGNFASLAGTYDFGVAKVVLGYADGGGQLEGISTGFVAPVAGFNVGTLLAYNTENDGYAVEVFLNKEIYKNTIAYVEATNASKKVPVNASKGSDSTGFALGLIYLF